jgi:hypothetical protein
MSLTRKDFRGDTEVAHFAGDQVTVLATGV